MDRDLQREIGVIRLGAEAAVGQGVSTLQGTIHADEVLMEHLARAGVELLGDYSAEQRRRMALAGQAMGNGSFPIANCSDAELAMRAYLRAPVAHQDAVLSFVRRRAFALGCSGDLFT